MTVMAAIQKAISQCPTENQEQLRKAILLSNMALHIRGFSKRYPLPHFLAMFLTGFRLIRELGSDYKILEAHQQHSLIGASEFVENLEPLFNSLDDKILPPTRNYSASEIFMTLKSYQQFGGKYVNHPIFFWNRFWE